MDWIDVLGAAFVLTILTGIANVVASIKFLTMKKNSKK